LRLYKQFDPTLGIYAAYAYCQIGNFNDIRSVHSYMVQSPEPLPFDVALLAKMLPSELNQMDEVAPFCPMLTQGWGILAGQEDSIPNSVRRARAFLVPSLWTTFTAGGMEI